MIHLGIDLGTSNTLAAYMEDGKLKLFEFEDGTMVPSIIHIEEPGGYESFGKDALFKWADPGYGLKSSFRRWKLDIGESKIIRHLEIGGSKIPITPECLTTKMVGHVLDKITQGLGGKQVESVLVTVPHGWRREKPEKCQMTRKAAADAVCQGVNIHVQETTVSEPVAAAAYWIWAMRNDGRSGLADDLDGKTILVCDIGGGTFDLSLVSVGAPGKPHKVVHAANSNYAGDYVDALIVAEVCRAFNSKFNSGHPVTAEKILELLDSESHAWLRKWFEEAKEKWKEKIAYAIEKTKDISKIVPIKGHFDDGQKLVRFEMDVAAFTQCFTPFYEQGRKLLKKFLAKLPKDELPSAVVFSGGGSKIQGIREHIVEPVLTEIMGSKENAIKCLQRITVNPSLIDRAIVYGAALIANSMVQVQEMLLSDVGIIVTLPSDLSEKLGIPDGVDTLMSPILKRGSPLPARMESHSMGIIYQVKLGETLPIQVVIDDDDNDPFIQEWQISIPPRKNESDPQKRSFEWVMAADTDGMLSMTVKPPQGKEKKWEGRFERKISGRTRIIAGAAPPGQETRFFRVSPDQIRLAREELNGSSRKHGGAK
jgi:molecular chaperone DnaK